jgi:hypothetical protein
MFNYKQAIAALGICIIPAAVCQAASVPLSNSGFESSWTDWTSSGSSAISTSDYYEGGKSAKLSGSSGTFSRVVSVAANTDYTLSAYILGDGKLNAIVSGTTYTATVSTSSWTKTSVNFNSGSATSITISGTYNGSTGRFDAFSLDSVSSSSAASAIASSVASSVASSSASSTAAPLLFTNPGFESSWQDWTASGSTAISTSDYYEGGKSAKIDGASGMFSRSFSVSANTTYTLSAYLLGKGKLAATVNGTNYTQTGDNSSWSQISLSFNTGSATSVTIGAEYNGGTGRFDSFDLAASGIITSSAAASSTPSSTAASSTASSTSSVNPSGVPADLSDVQFLSKWKITLPITFTNDPNKAGEVKQPSLQTYSHPDYFHLGANGTSIIFKAIAGGARTSTGTAYPRSELREMAGTGTTNAAWNCTGTSNGMSIHQALLTTTPTDAPNATIAQIHDASNDNLMVKYFGPATGANGTTDTGVIEARFNNDTQTVQLDPAYKLGDEMTIDVTTTPSGVRVQYENLRTGVTADTSTIAMSGVSGSCFYKAGLYIQTCSKVDIYGQTNSVCVAKNFPEGRYAQPWDSAILEMYSLQLANPQ